MNEFHLADDIARCDRRDCPLHLKCARWLDRLPFDDTIYSYYDFDPESCDGFIDFEEKFGVKKG